MTLQIVIPGIFTASGLPDLGFLGFVDTFERPDATVLGYTEKPARAWRLSNSAHTGGIINGEAYVQHSGSGGLMSATADARTSDGVLEAELGSFGAGQFGVTFRDASTADMFRFCSIDGVAYRLTKMQAGSSTTLSQTSGITPAPGDRLKVHMDGPSITCYVNDVEVLSATDSHNQDVTWHGIYNNTNTTANRVREIRFTAA